MEQITARDVNLARMKNPDAQLLDLRRQPNHAAPRSGAAAGQPDAPAGGNRHPRRSGASSTRRAHAAFTPLPSLMG
jgi:hypothetical protein